MASGFKYNAAWNKFYSAFSEALIDCGKQLTKQGETIMIRGCEEWLKKTDNEWPKDNMQRYKKRQFGGDHNHPWDTGTLHDSISVRIADGNRIIATRFMPSSATGPQTATAAEAGRDYDNIVGTVFGRTMAARANLPRQTGTNAQMFIGVPYAQAVDKQWQHEGYINELNVDFVSFLEDLFTMKGNYYFRNLIVRPRK